MELFALNFDLSTTTILCTLLVASLIDSTRTLQIFNGTLTEITCSAAVPVFRLVDQEREYDFRDYNQLPDLFDIEAIPSPNRDNVTLIINGTERSNNLTIICRNEDVFSGQFQTLFTLILEFVGILPAPNNVQFSDSAGHLQIFWEPPTLVSDKLGSQYVSIDSKITHFKIYITTEESTIVQVYNTSGTSFAIGIDKIPCSFWFQVAAVNPAGVGEHSPTQYLIFDSHTGCIDSTRSTTHIIIEPIPASSGLSAGEIAAVIVGVVCSLAGVCIILVIVLLKMYPKLNGMNRHSKTTKEEIEMKQNEIYGINTRPL